MKYEQKFDFTRANTTTKINAERLHRHRSKYRGALARKTATKKLALCLTEFVLEWVMMDQARADQMFEYFYQWLRYWRGSCWTRILKEYFVAHGNEAEAALVGTEIIERMYKRQGQALDEEESYATPSVCEARKEWTIHLCSTPSTWGAGRRVPDFLKDAVEWLTVQPSEAFAEGGTLGWREACMDSIISYHVMGDFPQTDYWGESAQNERAPLDELNERDESIVQARLNLDLLSAVERAAIAPSIRYYA